MQPTRFYWIDAVGALTGSEPTPKRAIPNAVEAVDKSRNLPEPYMIVPQFWAEGRMQHKQRGRQVTVHRFGWSDIDQADAQANADKRAGEALKKILAGADMSRREPKVAYNGAEGVPIREEIVSREGDTVVTRNSYGARCINTPNVFFADIDFQYKSSFRFALATFVVLLLCAAAVGWVTSSKAVFGGLVIVALFAASTLANRLHGLYMLAKGGVQQAARKRVIDFSISNPAWNFRLYRTPAGLRVMATHRTFSPDDPEVSRCFTALGTDPVYALMCLRQQCFRARVSPKPWRIGIESHLKPRPGVWPVSPAHLPGRAVWVAEYEAAAESFAACAYLESVGSGVVNINVAPVQQLHDALCKASEKLPIA